MTDIKGKFYPGKRVEVLVSLAHYSCWFRGTVTKSRTREHQGKIRVWLDQLPAGWRTHEVLFSRRDLFGRGTEIVRPLNQPDRVITPLWELNAIFFFSALVSVTDGVQSQEGAVIKPPTDESPNIGVRLFKGQGKREFPYHPLRIERVYGKKDVSSSSSLYLV